MLSLVATITPSHGGRRGRREGRGEGGVVGASFTLLASIEQSVRCGPAIFGFSFLSVLLPACLGHALWLAPQLSGCSSACSVRKHAASSMPKGRMMPTRTRTVTPCRSVKRFRPGEKRSFGRDNGWPVALFQTLVHDFLVSASTYPRVGTLALRCHSLFLGESEVFQGCQRMARLAASPGTNIPSVECTVDHSRSGDPDLAQPGALRTFPVLDYRQPPRCFIPSSHPIDVTPHPRFVYW